MAINDSLKTFYQSATGLTGSISELEWAWLYTQVTPFKGALPDMWREFFRLKGLWVGSLPDSWNLYLKSFGNTGSISDMKNTWAVNSQGGNTPKVAIDNIAVLFGDSRTKSDTYTNNPLRMDRGYMVHARQNLMGKIDFNKTHVVGQSGYRTDQLISTWLPTALATSGGSVFILAGTNDTGVGTPLVLGDSTANLLYMVTQFRAANKVVFICDEIPRADGSGFNQTHLTGIRDYIRTLHNPVGGIYVVPTWNAVATVADGIVPKTDYLRDGLHFATLGAQACGIAVATVAGPALPAINLLTRPVVQGGNFSTTGGTIAGALVSGVAPAVAGAAFSINQGATGSMTGTIVSSVLNNPDGDGINWWQMVIDLTAPTSPLWDVRGPTTWNTGFTAGTDYLDTTIRLRVLPGSQNLARISLKNRKNGGQYIPSLSDPAADADWAGTATTYAVGAGGIDVLLRTPHVQFQAASTQLYPWIDFGGIANQNVKATIQIAMPQMSIYTGELTDA